MLLTLIVLSIFAIALVLRVLPHRLAPEGAGVDHWFWRTYVEAYQRTRKFPPHLPQYVLDEEQWYPPVFPLLMARLPARVFDRWSQHVAIVFDLLRLALLLAIVGYLSGGAPVAMLIAGLSYATTPIQVSYNIQLNPRGIAALMLDMLLLMLLWRIQGAGWWVYGPTALLSGLILLTHKMNTQLFWFVVLGTALLYRRWEFALLVPVSIVVAMVLSGGFYWKVLCAHWDIIKFWNAHWRWIGADLIRESPIYGDGRYERAEKLHKSGVRGLIWHAFILFGFNPAAWISCLLVFERLSPASSFLIYPTPLLVWLLLPCAFALLTTFVPRLKCLGAGYLYVYNTSLFASVILALTFTYSRMPTFSTLFVILAILANVAGLLVYYRQFLQSPRTRVDDTLGRMIEEIKSRPNGLVMCIPTNWHEVIAYRTGRPVLWGGHGYGFRRLEPTWPRLLIPIDEVVRRYGVRYLLTTDEMLTNKFEAALPPATLVQKNGYRLYCFDTPHVTQESIGPASGYRSVQR